MVGLLRHRACQISLHSIFIFRSIPDSIFIESLIKGLIALRFTQTSFLAIKCLGLSALKIQHTIQNAARALPAGPWSDRG